MWRHPPSLVSAQQAVLFAGGNAYNNRAGMASLRSIRWQHLMREQRMLRRAKTSPAAAPHLP
jgi:hypothetical protein